MQLRTRRTFLHQAVMAATAATVLHPALTPCSRALAASPNGSPIRLGGPGFVGSDDPEAYILAHRKLGYSAAYSPDVKLNDSDKIRAFVAAAKKHDVVIAEVGRWVNLLDADSATRKQNLQVVTDGLALAEALEARCCVDIAGSFNPKSWFGPHPENFSKKFFDAAVENARTIIDAVLPSRTHFAYEMMGWALPDSPDNYLKLVKAVDRKAFAVHLDPCNGINSPERFYRSTDFLNECFDKLGKYIVSCHAKDLAWEIEMNVHFKEVIPGQGSLDYAPYLKRLAALPKSPPLMLEHLASPADYATGRDHILAVGRAEGLSFA